MKKKIKSMFIWALRRGQVKSFIQQAADVRSRLEKFNEIWADAVKNVLEAEKVSVLDSFFELLAWPENGNSSGGNIDDFFSILLIFNELFGFFTANECDQCNSHQ